MITGVCTTVAEAKADLAGTVAEVGRGRRARGLGLMCAGTHPITDWSTQRISPKERYRKLVERMQWLARQLQIFGVHVHVGVRAPDKAIPIVNALRQYVPHFLALSASSPYWMGGDTGLASCADQGVRGPADRRPAVPAVRLGRVRAVHGDADHRRSAIESVREVWWDIRPHPDFGTVELRICDGLPTLDEVGAVAAMAQCLVEQFDGQLDRGYTLPEPQAGWFGRTSGGPPGTAWTPRSSSTRRAPSGRCAQAILELVDDLTPTAQRLGCEDELAASSGSSSDGATYQRQRAVAAAHGGDLRPVVDSLLEEMRDGLPTGGRRPAGPRRRDGAMTLVVEKLGAEVDDWVAAHDAQLVTFRRELHPNPELAYAEHGPPPYLEQRLRARRAASRAAARPAPGWSATSAPASAGRRAAGGHRRAAAAGRQGRAVRVPRDGRLPRLRSRCAHDRRCSARRWRWRPVAAARPGPADLPAGRGGRARRRAGRDRRRRAEGRRADLRAALRPEAGGRPVGLRSGPITAACDQVDVTCPARAGTPPARTARSTWCTRWAG